MASYSVRLANSVRKDIRRVDGQLIPKIYARIEALAKEPRPLGTIKIKGSENNYRIRVGDYRIIYEIDDGIKVVSIQKVGHRRDVYG